MPFAGAAEDLARAFEFEFVNGYAAKVDTRATNFTFVPGQGLDIKPVGDLGLPPTAQVVTFTGQAFKIPVSARSILTLAGEHVALLPTIAGQFDQSTPVVKVTGYSQGAVSDFGNGRIAVFGEAAAFSAQVSRKGGRMGMNSPGAEENAPFVLKILRWLARYQPSP